MPIAKPIAQRLLESCDRLAGIDGCWIWNKCLGPGGYGSISVGSRKDGTMRTGQKTHRISYETFKGPINGLHVLHKCDTPACINPAHLFLGTHRENMQDMQRKGRKSDLRGQKCGMAKLRDEEVLLMRKLKSERKMNNRELAEEFGVSIACAQHATKGRTFQHLLMIEEAHANPEIHSE